MGATRASKYTSVRALLRLRYIEPRQPSAHREEVGAPEHSDRNRDARRPRWARARKNLTVVAQSRRNRISSLVVAECPERQTHHQNVAVRKDVRARSQLLEGPVEIDDSC